MSCRTSAPVGPACTSGTFASDTTRSTPLTFFTASVAARSLVTFAGAKMSPPSGVSTPISATRSPPNRFAVSRNSVTSGSEVGKKTRRSSSSFKRVNPAAATAATSRNKKTVVFGHRIGSPARSCTAQKLNTPNPLFSDGKRRANSHLRGEEAGRPGGLDGAVRLGLVDDLVLEQELELAPQRRPEQVRAVGVDGGAHAGLAELVEDLTD